MSELFEDPKPLLQVGRSTDDGLVLGGDAYTGTPQVAGGRPQSGQSVVTMSVDRQRVGVAFGGFHVS